MKRVLIAAALFVALMLLFASCAAAAGNVTIAVQGQDGFEDYVSSMFVWDGRLLMVSWDSMYTWKPGDEGVTLVEGYEEVGNAIHSAVEYDEDGAQTYTFGEDELELEAEQGLSLYSNLIAAGNTLLRQATVYGEGGEERALLIRMNIDEDGMMQATGMIELSDDMLVDYGGDYTGVRDISTPCYVGGMVYCLSYGENGREMVAIDLESGDVDAMTLDTESEIMSLSPFTDGKLLMVALDTSVDPMVTDLLSYDVESEEVENLGAIPNNNWNMPCAIAFDEARGMIYYALGGSVWRMRVTEEGLGSPEEFGDMPLEVYSDSSAVLLDNYYILSSYEGVVGRDVDMDTLPEQRLRVMNMGYVEQVKQAYFDFTDAHPEYMVSISDGSSADTILQDMMNRSSDVDIYTLEVATSQFAALYNRGFMAELGGNEAISSAVSAMYESIQDAVIKDGEIYALPMSVYSDAMSMNIQLLTEKLGYEEKDIPSDWPALFALFGNIVSSGKLEEFPEVTLMMPGYTQRDAKYNFFTQMMSSYFLWLDQSEENLMRGSEVLLALCQAFEGVDWAALGLPEEFDYEEDNGWEYEPENILMDNTSIDPRYYYEAQQTPLVLAVAEGEPQLIGFDLRAAFVNPFSKHREAATEYIETAYGLLDHGVKVALMPGENEPVENKYFEENLKNYDENIADMEKQLADESLTDEETREMLMQSIEDMKGYREEYIENGKWDISPEAIERYRRFAAYGAVTRASVWESGAYSQIYQYLDGAMTAQQLCQELEKTMQMQRLEGM